VRQIRSIVGPRVKLYVCLKGDAFGCGAIAVAKKIESIVDGLTFGSIDAALACRRAGIGLPMLLYPNCLPESAPLLEKFRLVPTLSTLEDVAAWSARVTAKLNVFLKIDTGALRAGAEISEARRVAEAIVGDPRL